MASIQRNQLIKLLDRINLQIARAESLTAAPADNATLLLVSKQLAELKQMRADVEAKLRATE